MKENLLGFNSVITSDLPAVHMDITPQESKATSDTLPANNPADFRLTRLILIDSYARGKTVEIDLSGHTALTGENASGKTTLLRLFPLFFGEAPSRVI